MNIVLIETSSNQRYIFSTNKLRENVGASELTHKIGAEVAKTLAISTDGIEPIITTSGKALLLAEDCETAKNFVKEITTHALKEMPGLTVHGAICEVKDENSAESLHEAVGDVHKRLEEIRYQMPGNLQRFQRIPFVAECASSNLPASEVVEFRNEQGMDTFAFSKPILAKREVLAKDKTKKSNKDKFTKSRIVRNLRNTFDINTPKNLEKLEDAFPNTRWLAVVHADGNGLGQIFLNFNNRTDMTDAASYKRDYRDFSNAIDSSTKNAFGKALQSLGGKTNGKQVPVIPLIMGGDDISFICDGEYAIRLTKNFLREFETQCSSNEVINRLTAIDGKVEPLGICAGIAIIKPHFPFHQAYSLAAELLQSAKTTKRISTSLSALDYHILYDSSVVSLDEIRKKTPFTAKPYIVTPKRNAEDFTKEDGKKDWIKKHHFCELAKRVEALREDEDGERKLPNSQMHVLREGLFTADSTEDVQKEVDARSKLIARRYSTFKELFVEDESLFFKENKEHLTHFLDALESVEFWKGGDK